MFSFFLVIPRVGFLGHMVTVYLTFLKVPDLSTVAGPFYILSATYEDSGFSISSPILRAIWHILNVLSSTFVSLNSFVETLISNVMVFG